MFVDDVEEELNTEEDETILDSDEEPLPSPDDVVENIKRKYLLEMPEDFYEFWEFCCHLNSKKPRGNILYNTFKISYISNGLEICTVFLIWLL